MIASYERTSAGSLKITCISHNVSEGDEVRIEGSTERDGTFAITE